MTPSTRLPTPYHRVVVAWRPVHLAAHGWEAELAPCGHSVLIFGQVGLGAMIPCRTCREQSIEFCPACQASWVGPPIPEAHRNLYYGGKTNFSRKVGHIENDRVVYWSCPDCKVQFRRGQ